MVVQEVKKNAMQSAKCKRQQKLQEWPNKQSSTFMKNEKRTDQLRTIRRPERPQKKHKWIIMVFFPSLRKTTSQHLIE